LKEFCQKFLKIGEGLLRAHFCNSACSKSFILDKLGLFAEKKIKNQVFECEKLLKNWFKKKKKLKNLRIYGVFLFNFLN
jgi:hypothetical protein